MHAQWRFRIRLAGQYGRVAIFRGTASALICLFRVKRADG